MKLNKLADHVIDELISNKRVIVCEACHKELADTVYTYEFESGEVLSAQVCHRCFLSTEEDSDFCRSLIEKHVLKLDAQIAILEYLPDM